MIPAAALVNDNAFAANLNANSAQLRLPGAGHHRQPALDQAWGFVGISAALHDASGAYYDDRRTTGQQRPSRRQVRLGVGWRRQVQPCRRRHDRLQRLLRRRRSGFCTNNNASQLYNSSTSVGVGWIADGVFTTGTQIELTKVWSALAGYEHIWNPKWRTSVFGGYVNVDYSSAATNGILQHTPGALAACGVARCRRD